MKGRLKEKFLLYRIRTKKDPDAFGEIYDAYVERIYRFVYFKVSSQQEAEDLTSDTFLKAWQYLQGNRDVPYLQALLYSTARSVVIDHYRSAVHQHRDVPIDVQLEDKLSDGAHDKMVEEIQHGLDIAKVLERLALLKDEYREVVIMRYLDDLSPGEIAEALGKTPANVRVLVHRATNALVQLLNKPNELEPQKNPDAGKTR